MGSVKKVIIGLAIFGLLSMIGLAAALSFLALRTLKPEKVDHGLQRELSALGVTVGKSTQAEVVARFGAPEQERQETLSTVLAYPSRGLLVRMGKQSGVLEWVEFTSGEFATAKGIKVGATYQSLVDTYGLPSSVTPLSGSTRVRYQFGLAYMLEFTLNKENQVTRVAFFKA